MFKKRQHWPKPSRSRVDIITAALGKMKKQLPTYIALLLGLGSPEFSLLLLRLALLEKRLRNEKIVLGGDGPATRAMLE
jgi:hypothetical protein